MVGEGERGFRFGEVLKERKPGYNRTRRGLMAGNVYEFTISKSLQSKIYSKWKGKRLEAVPYFQKDRCSCLFPVM